MTRRAGRVNDNVGFVVAGGAAYRGRRARQTIAAMLMLSAGLAGNAWSEQKVIQLSTGTGFVVNPDGQVITNAHVVRHCRSFTVLTPAGERPATLDSLDETQDLAVLDVADARDLSIAPLRWNIRDLKVGDAVLVSGYPGHAALSGELVTRSSTVQALEGPTGEPVWIQLGAVAEHGNSGGPVLDSSGHVIAVLTGMAKTYRTDPRTQQRVELIGQSDIAITLASLQDFMHKHRVSFYERQSSQGVMSAEQIGQEAKKFIVAVRCVLSEN